MILYHKENWGCVYSIDENTKEILYTPVYQDDKIYLNDFISVDECDYDDNDLIEFQEVQNYLVQCLKQK